VLVGFNGIAQIAPIMVAFALTPLILDRIGLDRFGIWSLALVVLGTLTTLDAGISASLARFFAIYAARDGRADTGRLLLGALVLFTGLAVLLTTIAFPIVPPAVEALNIPAGLHDEAIMVLRWLPPLAGLGLMADAAAAVLQGNGQFRALAAAMLASSGAFALAVILLLDEGPSLDTLLVATALRYGVLAVVSLALAAHRVTFRRPLLPSRATWSELWRFSSRMQLSSLAGFVNSQLDALVIAAVLPVRYVGLYGIGMQAAAAARSVPLYAFAPLLTLFSRTFGEHGREAAAAEFERFENRWLPGVMGYGLVAVAAIGFSVPIWLGDDYHLAGLTAAILLAGYTVHVGLTGMRTCYVRAIGRPGLETRYSSVWMIGNAAITIPCALLAGMLGVVGATALTGIVASVYFVVLCRRREQLPVVVPGRRSWAWAAVTVAITVVGELAILATGLHGFFPLALTLLPPAAALLMLVGRAGRAPRATAVAGAR
jgi:O-antigen/teichoic acid export membrane protein